jgi:hypothetical protein
MANGSNNGSYEPCYNAGRIKVTAAKSTSSIARYVQSDPHSMYLPGVTEPSLTTGLNCYLEAVHPLQAEFWRADFLNWITHDDISFE